MLEAKLGLSSAGVCRLFRAGHRCPVYAKYEWKPRIQFFAKGIYRHSGPGCIGGPKNHEGQVAVESFSACVETSWIVGLLCLYAGCFDRAGGRHVFWVFPEDYGGVFNYGALASLTGVSGSGMQTVHTPVAFWMIAIAISAVFIPVQLLELGEEIGWREYLLPRQVRRFGLPRAVLLNSFLWGAAHLPLIYFGFNYSVSNPGAPWSNMAMMLLMCMAVGVICCYVTIISGNAMFAAIVHGVVNIIGEIPVFLSLGQENGLLGPNPTGLIGMAGLLLCAVVLLVRLGNREKHET